MASSFFVSSEAVVTIDGSKLYLKHNDQEAVLVHEDTLPITSVEVLDDGVFVFGGESKRIIGMQVEGQGAKKIYEIESKRKIFKLVRLNRDLVLLGDSAGGVKSFDWRVGQDKGLTDLFAHFAQLTVLTVIGQFIVSADMDFQVRVCKISHPREIVAFLLGSQCPVFKIFRGKSDFEIFCVDNEKKIRAYHIVDDGAVEIDPFQDAVQALVAVQNQHKRTKTVEEAKK